MEQIAIIGGGLMGAGLAQLFSARGHTVYVAEPSQQARESLHQRIREICDALAEGSDCSERVRVTQRAADAAAQADFVIEAASERIELKQDLFVEIAGAAPSHAILATNSSVIPVATVAAKLDDAAATRAVGTHFWNPPYLVPLVEVIQAPRTLATTVETAMDLLRRAGKTPVHLRRDVVAGNRLQHALWREAIALVAEGVCEPGDVDTLVKSSFGLRLPVLGPLENADLVGLDLTCRVHEIVFPTLNCDITPSPLLTKLLDAGQLGMRTGQGFYPWTPETAQAARQRLTAHLRRTLRELPEPR